MNTIYFLIGASGSGKTTVTKEIEEKSIEGFKTVYFDSIGIPSLEEMNEKYNGPEEFQRIKTMEWVKLIKKSILANFNVILDGQTRPGFIKEACLKYHIKSYKIILFDCSDSERIRRLIKRGQPELASENMMNWATYLRKQCQAEHFEIIDTTDLTVEKTYGQLANILNINKNL